MNNPPEGDSLDQGSDKDSDEEYLESTCDEANKAFDENITKGPRKFECKRICNWCRWWQHK